MLAAMRENGGRVRSGKESHGVTLCDLGVAKHDSSRWQRVAAVP
jgi:hypothetical protein